MKHIRIGLVGTGCMGKTHLYSVGNLPLPTRSVRRRSASDSFEKRGSPIC